MKRDFARQMWEELGESDVWEKVEASLGGDFELLECGTLNRLILMGDEGAFSIEYQIHGSSRPTRPKGATLDLYHSYMEKARCQK
jgi:hypothetical protein